MNEITQLLRRPVDVQRRVFRIRREEQREAVLANLDVGVVVRVRTGHVDGRQIDSDVRHVFTVSDEAGAAR